jgi:hypothetical protein
MPLGAIRARQQIHLSRPRGTNQHSRNHKSLSSDRPLPTPSGSPPDLIRRSTSRRSRLSTAPSGKTRPQSFLSAGEATAPHQKAGRRCGRPDSRPRERLPEAMAHAWIDFGKNDGWYGFHLDQLMHVLCKLIWLLWRAWAANLLRRLHGLWQPEPQIPVSGKRQSPRVVRMPVGTPLRVLRPDC